MFDNKNEFDHQHIPCIRRHSCHSLMLIVYVGNFIHLHYSSISLYTKPCLTSSTSCLKMQTIFCHSDTKNSFKLFLQVKCSKAERENKFQLASTRRCFRAVNSTHGEHHTTHVCLSQENWQIGFNSSSMILIADKPILQPSPEHVCLIDCST